MKIYKFLFWIAATYAGLLTGAVAGTIIFVMQYAAEHPREWARAMFILSNQ